MKITTTFSSLASHLLALLVFTSETSAQIREYERVLVPVAIQMPLPGAFGSLWITELIGRNPGSEPVHVTSSPFGCRIPEGCFEYAYPYTTFRPYLSSPNGGPHFLMIEKPGNENIALSLRIRDIARGDQAWGTSIPVVYEEDYFSGGIQILDIPSDSGFRSSLRVFDYGAINGSCVEVSVHELSTYEPLVKFTMVLDSGATDVIPIRPAHNRIDSLTDAFPELKSVERLRIQITPITPETKFWAFASVTNNSTQHVTVVLPATNPVSRTE